MADVNLTEYRNLYLETVENYLKELELNLTTFSQNPDNQGAVAGIHRIFHSLKSSSLVMNYMNLASICSVFENIFYDIKNGKIKITSEILILIKDASEILKKTLENIKNTGSEIDLTDELNKIEKVTGIRSSIKI